MKNPKIAISAYGKFDLFRWAEGFQKKGLLFKLFTEFYSKKTPLLSWRRKDTEDIDLEKVETFFWPRFWRPILRKIFRSAYFENVWFDRWTSKRILGSDIFLTRSSTALETIKVAKAHGIKTILYRGSSEIRFQHKIRREEFTKFGLEGEYEDGRSVERELEEYRLTDYIYTPSSYSAKTYVDSGIPAEKIIHFPLSAEKFESVVKKEHAGINVVYVGSVSVAKGVPYLLEAASRLADRKDISFTLIGNISSEMEEIRKKYEGNIDYAGKVRHHKLADFYGEADFLVFPTTDDGFGQVMVEAMSCGLPVIATDHSGAPDIIEDGVNGFVVPAGNSEKILEKIMFFYGNRDKMRQMGENAKKTADNFPIDKFTDNWINFFKKSVGLKNQSLDSAKYSLISILGTM